MLAMLDWGRTPSPPTPLRASAPLTEIMITILDDTTLAAELRLAPALAAEATRNGLPFNAIARAAAPGWHEMQFLFTTIRRQQRTSEVDQGRRPATRRDSLYGHDG
jgi:hypothetical protein